MMMMASTEFATRMKMHDFLQQKSNKTERKKKSPKNETQIDLQRVKFLFEF